MHGLFFGIAGTSLVMLMVVVGLGKAYQGVMEDQAASLSKVSTPSVMTYTGKLPCADCSAINSTLQLRSDGKYVQTNVYQGKNVPPQVETGLWMTSSQNVDAKNPKAMVYQLLAKGAQKVQNYLIESGALKPLDTNFRPVAAPVDLSLKKQ